MERITVKNVMVIEAEYGCIVVAAEENGVKHYLKDVFGDSVAVMPEDTATGIAEIVADQGNLNPTMWITG